MVNDAEKEKLLNRVRYSYGTLLNFFREGSLGEKVAVAITPVQTLGTIIYSRCILEEEEPRFLYTRSSPAAQYAPKDCEQPLRYLLRFLLAAYDRHEGWTWLWFRLLFLVFYGKDRGFEDAMRTFAEGSKHQENDRGFMIVQGANWLETKRKTER